MNVSNLQTYIDKLVLWAGEFTPRVIGAILTLVIGFWIIKKLNKMLQRILEKREADVSLQTFLGSLVSVGLKVLLIISAAGMIGFQTTSLIAVIGAAGLAIGLALQGSLANFAGGVLILMFKPFRVGEVVTVQGITGVVTEIQIFNTILSTGDGKIAILPNGAVANGNIINASRTGMLMANITVKVPFDEDFEKVKQVVIDELKQDDRILEDPPIQVFITSYEDNNMVISVRARTKTGDYWPVFFDANQNIRKALVAHDIKGPVTAKVMQA
ncbi:mechanosensitive ion channel protein [Chitinophaga caeni]|uniref:Mechanosensitive ion channel protein n=1 Tax=Chitinophaga caeni TaxID=2029983 RepID=A0A291R033_9BACT|nr:mechanosensitive ion channel domain-containing protein [Chitinophaga caeni]ATL49521.1 mechanosensitive ion channel protein [Chitinophaga caeni]